MKMESISKHHFGIPLLVILTLAMIILPLPPFLLDMLFTFNIAFSLIVLLACIYTKRPLDFSIFPTILLLATLLRLALNIASTRVVLLNGHNGTAAAGQVIKSFGEVVIGSNYTVGIVVFSILVIINFVVVTKGAGRVSEVSARFKLDALPGKQMAIDAELNAGTISQEVATERRQEIANEADFYGAMDGASKFVRGDAVAGLLIVFINIIGGLTIGITQYSMRVSSAAQTYSLLTIGDGLIAQIPSLLLSTAAAIMVTRVSSVHDISKQISEQLFRNPRILAIAAGIIGIIGVIPGMPHIAFVLLALSIAAITLLINRNQYSLAHQATKTSYKPQQTPITQDIHWDDIKPVETISIELSYGLLNLIDDKQNGQLMTHIKNVRRKRSQQLGFLIPAVTVKDNFSLATNQYRIAFHGVTLAEDIVHADKHLAIHSGNVSDQIDGISCKDPSFGLDAIWINPSQKEQAQNMGYTVVDASTVIATHFSKLIEIRAANLFGHEEAQQLLTKLEKSTPKLAEALTSSTLPHNIIVNVLQQLLKEKVPITDFRTIAETLVEYAPKNTEPEFLTSMVRIALKRLIVQSLCSHNHSLNTMTLAPELEQKLLQSVIDNSMNIEPEIAEKLHNAIADYEQSQVKNAEPAILLVSPTLRIALAKFLRNSIPGLHLLSYQEIPDDKEVKITGSIN